MRNQLNIAQITLLCENISFSHFPIKLQRFDLLCKVTRLCKATRLSSKIAKPYKVAETSYKALMIKVLIQIFGGSRREKLSILLNFKI